MALQGTLDTFALIDVFRFWRRRTRPDACGVTGDRGIGNVWFDGGGVVLAAAYNTKPSDAPVRVIFELLRQHEGTFVFEADVTTPEAGAPSDVEYLIREAEHLLIEWQEIEAVVPSVDLWVSLSTELPRPEIVVDGERWKVIVAHRSGRDRRGGRRPPRPRRDRGQQGREGSRGDRPAHDHDQRSGVRAEAPCAVEHIRSSESRTSLCRSYERSLSPQHQPEPSPSTKARPGAGHRSRARPGL